ncbi:MAG: 5'-nucleotidase C-terminal domain-containing protein [Fimbriimonadia bacterium]
MVSRTIVTMASFWVAAFGCGQTLSLSEPGSGPSPVAQMVADAMRAAASADVAFIAAGFFVSGSLDGPPSAEKLNKLLAYPGEEIYVLSLTGDQITKALERSLSLLPQSNRAFLQVSGLKVEYSAKAAANSRVKRVLVEGKALDAGKTYRVAMPATLARGALGYFTVWQREQISEQTGVTVETAVRRLLDGKSTWPLGEQDRLVGD